MDIIKLLPGLQKNVSLKNYTTFRIGGSAKYFFEAKTEQEIIKAITVAKQLNPVRDKSLNGVKLPFFVLGAGSNILVDDEGYKGIVIRIKNQNAKVKITNKNSKLIEADAGVMLGQIVNLATKNNLTGVEWAIGIPGTVGGAIWGNAGAFKKSMADITKNITVFDIKNQKIVILKNKDCKFGYRNSIFKKKNNLIILSAEINLKKSNKKLIDKKIKEYSSYRIAHQPLNFPSAGSIFKNFTLHRNKISGAGPALISEMEQFEKTKIIPAAWLIEKCGLKGRVVGGAKISEKHANFIINMGNAKGKDVKKLINLVKIRVKTKFGVVLHEEIQFL